MIAALGALDTELAATRIALDSMVAFAETAQPCPETTNTIFIHRALVCRDAIRTVDLALDAVGGAGYFRRLGLERLFRDVQGARFHPLQEGSAAPARGPHGARSADRRITERSRPRVPAKRRHRAASVGPVIARKRDTAAHVAHSPRRRYKIPNNENRPR